MMGCPSLRSMEERLGLGLEAEDPSVWCGPLAPMTPGAPRGQAVLALTELISVSQIRN
jgi:hypothetical protein